MKKKGVFLLLFVFLNYSNEMMGYSRGARLCALMQRVVGKCGVKRQIFATPAEFDREMLRGRLGFIWKDFLNMVCVEQMVQKVPNLVMQILYNCPVDDDSMRALFGDCLDDTVGCGKNEKGGTVNPAVIKAIQRAKVDGYSPISSVIISNGKTVDQKRRIIQLLVGMGVVSTQKDYEIARLEQFE